VRRQRKEGEARRHKDGGKERGRKESQEKKREMRRSGKAYRKEGKRREKEGKRKMEG